jgi:hypothetical protein
MKVTRYSLPFFLALLVGYIAGAMLYGPVKAFDRQSASTTQGSNEAVFFEGQRLELGMSKSEALARLAECCRMTGSKDSFFLASKHGPPFRMLGAIWFAEDKVSELKLHLDQFQERESSKLGRLLSAGLPRSRIPNRGAQLS